MRPWEVADGWGLVALVGVITGLLGAFHAGPGLSGRELQVAIGAVAGLVALGWLALALAWRRR